MATSNKKLLANKIAHYKKERIQFVKLAFSDIDGVMRGKLVTLDKFESIASSEGSFCDCVWGWDVEDKLYDNARYTGWHTAFPDAHFRVDLSSERILVEENNTPLYLIEFIGKNLSDPHPICPRSILQSVLKKAKLMDLEVNAAFEYEFFLFKETPCLPSRKKLPKFNTLVSRKFWLFRIKKFNPF